MFILILIDHGFAQRGDVVGLNIIRRKTLRIGGTRIFGKCGLSFFTGDCPRTRIDNQLTAAIRGRHFRIAQRKARFVPVHAIILTKRIPGGFFIGQMHCPLDIGHCSFNYLRTGGRSIQRELKLITDFQFNLAIALSFIIDKDAEAGRLTLDTPQISRLFKRGNPLRLTLFIQYFPPLVITFDGQRARLFGR